MDFQKTNSICDIIIPVWNQLKYTKPCLESLFQLTGVPFRLILVDNASVEQTAKYLFDIQCNRPEQVLLIRNNENLGFIKAVNQGFKQSTASYICLLNNDTKVTKGWLSEMIKIAQDSEKIGIVNPNSNTLGCKPEKGQSIQYLGRQLRAYSGEYSELAWATGFCMLIKRKVIQQVGIFDEIYGMGNFEDADFSKRAQKLGYLSVCAKAAYVYHHERRSFIRHKSFDRNFERNRQTFFAKWGRSERILYVLSKDTPPFLEKIIAESLKLARQGHTIWIFLKQKGRDLSKMKKHSNIYIYSLPEHLFDLVSLWRIIKRKKKFDKIYVDDGSYGKSLKKLKFLHKAEVVYAR